MTAQLEDDVCCQKNKCRWRVCAVCGRERRLAAGGEVMAGHNRWDTLAWAMARCEGSGQPPHNPPAGRGTAAVAAAIPAAGTGRAA